MPKIRKCPECEDGIIKNHSARSCWNCYNVKFRPLQDRSNFKTGSGEDHPNWKGGRWLYWRKQALIRDDYTCQHCGLKDLEIMDIDHIKPKNDSSDKYKNESHDLGNLQTLCPNCHKRKTIKEARFHTGHLKSR